MARREQNAEAGLKGELQGVRKVEAECDANREQDLELGRAAGNGPKRGPVQKSDANSPSHGGPVVPSLLELQRALAYDETFHCIQCGYCLPACPTYETTGSETHSPRGRIHLVKMAAEGKLTDLGLLSEAIDRCLGCRACESACPTGVAYGHIYEAAKSTLRSKLPPAGKAGAIKTLLLKHAFPHKRLLRAAGRLLRLYQRSGMARAAERWRLTRLLPEPLREFARVLPPVPGAAEGAGLGERLPPAGPAKLRLAFFTGCVMDVLFARINRLSMQLLQQAGCEVVVLQDDTCCGALHAHSGDPATARMLAKRNIAAWEKLQAREPVDFVVNNAGGCGAMLAEYGRLLHDEPEWRERAEAFSACSRDISQVLTLAGPLPWAAETGDDNTAPQPAAQIVTYQPSCHMTHVQKAVREPLALLSSIPGITLREMADKDKCCGSAGIYNLEQYESSMEILDVKMSHAKATGAQTIVTTNPGCLLQMRLGIAREGLEDRVRAVHLVELVAEACGLD